MSPDRLAALESLVEAWAERMATVGTQEDADRLGREIDSAGATFTPAEILEFLRPWLARRSERRASLVKVMVQIRAGEIVVDRSAGGERGEHDA